MAAIDSPLDSFGNVKIGLPQALDQAGYAVLAGERHNGLLGLSARRQPVQMSQDGRMQLGQDTAGFEDFFNYGLLNTRNYQNFISGMSTAMAGGFLVLNNAGSLAAANGNLVRSYRSFALTGNNSLRFHCWFALAAVPQANSVLQLGLGIPSLNANTLSLDGIFMVLDSAGVLSLNAYYNNTTPITSAAIAFTWVLNKVYHMEMVLHRDIIELYLDDVLYASLERKFSAASAGAFAMSQYGHFCAQLMNTGAVSTAQKLSIAGYHVSQSDLDFGKSYAAQRSAMGKSLLTSPDGAVMASLSNAPNSAVAANATLSNTAGSYAVTVLDGRFQFLAPAGAETDYALFAYQVPVGTAVVPGQTLVVTGVSIDALNLGAAVAGTATLMEWAIGVGSTAVSLATADAVSTRAPARKQLGSMVAPIGAAIGARFDRVISEDFSGMPLPAEPGTFVHVILRVPVGTATASQVIRGNVTIKGYWE